MQDAGTRNTGAKHWVGVINIKGGVGEEAYLVTLPVAGLGRDSQLRVSEENLDVHYHSAGRTARSNRGRRSSWVGFEDGGLSFRAMDTGSTAVGGVNSG